MGHKMMIDIAHLGIFPEENEGQVEVIILNGELNVLKTVH